jgi:hypothetical protein
MKELWNIYVTYQHEGTLYVMGEIIMIDTEEVVKEAIEKLKQEEDIIDAEAERVNYYN